MISYSVTVSGPNLDALAQRLRGVASGQEIYDTAAFALRDAVQDHIRTSYGGRTNKLGGKTTGYWMAVADSVKAEADAASATVRVTHRGAALHYYGTAGLPGGVLAPKGTSEVTGKPIESLSIPVIAAAHGKTPAEVPGLYWRPIKGKKAHAGLFLQAGPKKAKTDVMWFALVRSMTLKADPKVLPGEDELRKAVADAWEVLWQSAAASELA